MISNQNDKSQKSIQKIKKLFQKYLNHLLSSFIIRCPKSIQLKTTVPIIMSLFVESSEVGPSRGSRLRRLRLGLRLCIRQLLSEL